MPDTEKAAETAAPVIPPKRHPGHRGQDVRDTVAEMAAKAHEISLEAGSKMAAAMKDVVGAAAGLVAFSLESARDLVQYMVRRGQMTQEEADKLVREAEEVWMKKNKGKLPLKITPLPLKPVASVKPSAPIVIAKPTVVAKPAAKPVAKPVAKPIAKPVAKPAAKAAAKPAPKPVHKAPAKPAAKKPAAKKPAAKKPVARKPAAKKPATKKPAPKK